MKHWLAVISLEHAQLACKNKFLQVCHGKRAPLARTAAGDEFFIYSPRTSLNVGANIMCISYHGYFNDDRIYQVEQFTGFSPFRKDVSFDTNFKPIKIKQVIGMQLTAQPNWGLILRRGFVELSSDDAACINNNQQISIY